VQPLGSEPGPGLRHREPGLEDAPGNLFAADQRRIDSLRRQPGRHARRIAHQVDPFGEIESYELDLDRGALVRRLGGIDAQLRHPPLQVRADQGRRYSQLVRARADRRVILVGKDPEVSAGQHLGIELDDQLSQPAPGHVELAGETDARRAQPQRTPDGGAGAVGADQVPVPQGPAPARDRPARTVDARDGGRRSDRRTRGTRPPGQIAAQPFAGERPDSRMLGVERGRRLALERRAGDGSQPRIGGEAQRPELANGFVREATAAGLGSDPRVLLQHEDLAPRLGEDLRRPESRWTGADHDVLDALHTRCRQHRSARG
jgi:hypothetical protein